jgi:hypothetical protein
MRRGFPPLLASLSALLIFAGDCRQIAPQPARIDCTAVVMNWSPYTIRLVSYLHLEPKCYLTLGVTAGGAFLYR